MHGSCVHFSLNFDFDAFYRLHWQTVVRYCATQLATCPDGMAEEVAQDVFLAAHHAIASQQYRGEGPIGTWLLGIARNRCVNARRDTYRHNTPLALRRRDQMPHDPARPVHERAWLARRVREALYPEWPIAPETQVLQREASRSQHLAVKRLSRLNPAAYALLHMHLIKGLSVRELAVLQGTSRSAMQRRLRQARAVLQDMAAGALTLLAGKTSR